MPCSAQPRSGGTAGHVFHRALPPLILSVVVRSLEEIPCHQVLDGWNASCWKGCTFYSFPHQGWQCLKEAVLEAHPLPLSGAGSVSLTDRSQAGQKAVCPAPPSALPLLIPSSSSSVYIWKDTTKKVKRSEAEEKGTSSSWNYPCSHVLLVLVKDCRIRNICGNVQKMIWGDQIHCRQNMLIETNVWV